MALIARRGFFRALFQLQHQTVNPPNCRICYSTLVTQGKLVTSSLDEFAPQVALNCIVTTCPNCGNLAFVVPD